MRIFLNFEKEESHETNALLIEINYFFGRTGLGGSAGFYARLNAAIDVWLAERDLAVGTLSSEETA